VNCSRNKQEIEFTSLGSAKKEPMELSSPSALYFTLLSAYGRRLLRSPGEKAFVIRHSVKYFT
jgi:hypothetical protein